MNYDDWWYTMDEAEYEEIRRKDGKSDPHDWDDDYDDYDGSSINPSDWY